MNKKTWIALAAFVVLVAVLLTVFFLTRPETEAGAKEITVTVIHADGSSKNFTYHTDEEYLGALLLAEGLITGSEGQYGLVIESVDGESADWEKDQAYWSLYEGEAYANQGVSKTPVRDGATYKLVYEKF